MHKILSLTLILALTLMAYAQGRSQQQFDIIIRGGTVYDGTGRAPVKADVGITGDRITAVGNLSRATAPTIIDAKGLAVAPGFINMLSHSETSWLVDSRSLSELREGVTTQIFGESSMGPLTDEMKQRRRQSQGDLKYDIEWTTLAEYLNYLEKRGISQMSPRLSGLPRYASTLLALKTNRLHPHNWTKCVSWFVARWRLAPWVSLRP